MNPPPRDLYARLDRVKKLWVDIASTPKGSPKHNRLVEEIRAESLEHLADVEAARGVDRRRPGADRRQGGIDPRHLRVDLRRRDRRR
jgi:hypothetical protein